VLLLHAYLLGHDSASGDVLDLLHAPAITLAKLMHVPEVVVVLELELLLRAHVERRERV
jgi:hypothetical protein